jgi:hypothetical protein
LRKVSQEIFSSGNRTQPSHKRPPEKEGCPQGLLCMPIDTAWPLPYSFCTSRIHTASMLMPSTRTQVRLLGSALAHTLSICHTEHYEAAEGLAGHSHNLLSLQGQPSPSPPLQISERSEKALQCWGFNPGLGWSQKTWLWVPAQLLGNRAVT